MSTNMIKGMTYSPSLSPIAQYDYGCSILEHISRNFVEIPDVTTCRGPGGEIKWATLEIHIAI